MSNLQPNCCLEFDVQKVDQHAGGKWLIHDTKRRKDNRWWEHSEKGVTDRRTDRQTIPFIELLGRSWKVQFDGLVQDRRNSYVLAVELRFSYTNPPNCTSFKESVCLVRYANEQDYNLLNYVR